jgi:phosphinothricin acetyltransferase
MGLRLGTRLYEAILPLLRTEDVHMAIAGVTLPNDASCALHERFGFNRVALEPEIGRKFDRYWDVVWYQKQIDGEPTT